MTKARAVPPEAGIGDLLDGAQFIDAYRLRVAGTGLEASEAARLALARQPSWGFAGS